MYVETGEGYRSPPVDYAGEICYNSAVNSKRKAEEMDTVLGIIGLILDFFRKSRVARIALVIAAIVLIDAIIIGTKTKQINAEAEARIAAAEQQYASQLALIQAQTQVAPTQTHTQSKVSAEAECLAKVVAGCATYSSENVQRAVAWCVLNRVDSVLYPDSIQEVCEQANQWQGYENAPLIDSICILCQNVIDTWAAGGVRDVPQGCLFLRMTEDGVELRTEFKGGNIWNVYNEK